MKSLRQILHLSILFYCWTNVIGLHIYKEKVENDVLTIDNRQTDEDEIVHRMKRALTPGNLDTSKDVITKVSIAVTG